MSKEQLYFYEYSLGSHESYTRHLFQHTKSYTQEDFLALICEASIKSGLAHSKEAYEDWINIDSKELEEGEEPYLYDEVWLEHIEDEVIKVLVEEHGFKVFKPTTVAHFWGWWDTRFHHDNHREHNTILTDQYRETLKALDGEEKFPCSSCGKKSAQVPFCRGKYFDCFDKAGKFSS